MKGRYALHATLFLARKLRAGVTNGARLQRMWLGKYQAETGFTPADEARSFRAAMETAKRVNAMRGR